MLIVNYLNRYYKVYDINIFFYEDFLFFVMIYFFFKDEFMCIMYYDVIGLFFFDI